MFYSYSFVFVLLLPVEQARASNANYTLGTTLNEMLTSTERMDAVLGSEVHVMEIEWKRQYEMMEASVKNQLADDILIDLLENTARAAQAVQKEKQALGRRRR